MLIILKHPSALFQDCGQLLQGGETRTDKLVLLLGEASKWCYLQTYVTRTTMYSKSRPTPSSYQFTVFLFQLLVKECFVLLFGSFLTDCMST